MNYFAIVVGLFVASVGLVNLTEACRVNSELLHDYTRRTIGRLLDTESLESLYWPDEPLPAILLSRATGINITLAETHFPIAENNNRNEIVNSTRSHNSNVSRAPSLIQDIFVTCSIGRDRSYTLAINLELDNPFKTIDLRYDIHEQASHELKGKKNGQFRIGLPQSSLLVQLSQRLKNDECLTINHVQLAPSVNYEIECADCDEQERLHLDNVFTRRMTQFDAEFDSIISEKLLLGLQMLLNQQRLDLDLYSD